MTEYIGKFRAGRLSAPELALVIRAISCHGDDSHPVPERDLLHLFGRDYAVACLTSALDDDELTSVGRVAALRVISVLRDES